jgi:anti-anti-sigma factor
MGVVTVDFDRAGGDLTVYIAGDLDQDTAPPLLDEILRHVRNGDQVVWLDLTDVPFCGAAGVSLFVRLNELIDAIGGRLTLYGPAPDVVRVLEACRRTGGLSIWTADRTGTSA